MRVVQVEKTQGLRFLSSDLRHRLRFGLLSDICEFDNPCQGVYKDPGVLR